MTTGALKAHFLQRGRTAGDADVELVHFLGEGAAECWLAEHWHGPGARASGDVAERARAALAAGLEPVVGISCYTWNVAEFLEIARAVKTDLPGVLVVAGGPHVQRAQDFLHEDGIDVVVLGEGEETLTELLDCRTRSAWGDIAGLAFVEHGQVRRTPVRPRATELDHYPTALDVIELRDARGEPRYRQVAYETSRGCPYRCSFCEWGTGAIGTKMYQFSLDRIRDDLERLVEGGLQDIWLCDSNFGALREDRDKAEIIVDLKNRTGRPNTFATSWSKNHNSRVQGIVRLMHANGLLWHYHLALQTLTPYALELSHRKNMRANDYEPIARTLAAEGVPIAAELIWGLPGDNLPEFECNLDHLMTVFPNINIFGYTLLPGTEFFEKRDEYRLETLPVAGYGKAKGEYVVGCHTFSRDEGEEGYFLITAYVILARGHVLPLTVRYLALSARVGVSRILRACLHALVEEFADAVEPEVERDLRRNRMAVYESRAPLYVRCIADPERTFAVICRTVAAELELQGAAEMLPRVLRVLELDRAFCPLSGPAATIVEEFDFPADRIADALGAMRLPEVDDLDGCLAPGAVGLEIRHPGLVGQVLLDPDGGSWMRGRVVGVHDGVAAAARATRTEGLQEVAPG
jgi:B12 binding domain/Radical SAM superfamily